MKFEKKVSWSILACGFSLVITFLGVNFFLKKVETGKVSLVTLQSKNKTSKNNSEWLRYHEISVKISGLSRGWQKPTQKGNVNNNDLGTVIPINDAVAKQINEIKRIHQEEIVGKLANAKRINNEYRLKLIRDVEFQYQEKLNTTKTKLEADMGAKRESQAKALAGFRKNLERKHQLTLINLELQKKMLIFTPTSPENQQREAERIELEIARIRGDIQREIDNYGADLEREFELYQKEKTAEYNAELKELQAEREKTLQVELDRFQQEQDNQFRAWKTQRQIEVEQGIKLRRIQQ